MKEQFLIWTKDDFDVKKNTGKKAGQKAEIARKGAEQDFVESVSRCENVSRRRKWKEVLG